MIPGFSSYAVGWATMSVPGAAAPLTAAGVVRLAHELGYGRVQLADNTPLHALSAFDLRSLHETAASTGVAIELGTRGLTSETLTTYLQLAVEFRSPFLRIVVDAKNYEPSRDQVIKLLREHLPEFAQRQVVLAIENHDRFKARELAEILAAVNSPWLGICLDTANSLGAGEDLHTVIAALAPYTVNVHLKDIRIRRVPYLQGFVVEGTPLGDGAIDLAAVLAAVNNNGRCQTVTLEHWVPPESTHAETVRKERVWCDRSTATMRRLFPTDFPGAVS